MELAQKIEFVNPSGHEISHACVVRIKPIFLPSNVTETVIAGDDAATRTARANAELKARYAAERNDCAVLAFDTVVGIGDTVLGKPINADDARRMFRLLCGNTHEVVTAVCLIANGKTIVESEKTLVTFGSYDGRVIDEYIDSGAPFDKAGGYNIADEALKPIIKSFDGDYDNIVGMPVQLTEKLIEENILYGEVGNSD